MRRSLVVAMVALALAALVQAAPGPAQVAIATSLGKQILQNVVFGSVKSELI
jgi:H+/gluconate symporter-like permease